MIRRSKSLARAPLALVLLGLTASPPARAADPTTAECLAASESSIKLRSEGKLHAVREQLLVCSAATCPADVRTECARRVDAVNAATPTIVFEAKDASGNDLAAVNVTMDGLPLTDKLVGTALSLDPGQHTFTFTVEGQPPVEKVIVIHEGEKDRHERIVLGPPADTTRPAPLGSIAPAAPDVSSGNGKTQRWLGVGAASVGVVGVVLGTVFGLTARSKWSQAQRDCVANACGPGSTAQSERTTAIGLATGSTITFLLGGLGLAGGALLWFMAPAGGAGTPTAPSAASLGVIPAVVPHGGSLDLRGSF